MLIKESFNLMREDESVTTEKRRKKSRYSRHGFLFRFRGY